MGTSLAANRDARVNFGKKNNKIKTTKREVLGGQNVLKSGQARHIGVPRAKTLAVRPAK